MIGSQILHYRILRRLGAGSMGVVYAAEDLKLRRTVALKFLPEELFDDPKALARLTREARAVSRLDHPNVGTLFALESFEDRTFLVMGFYDGETLAQRLHREPGLSLPESQRIALEMARGLQHAHAQGVVHRDLKPGNVLLAKQFDASLVTKILDFGLARLEQTSMQLTKPGSTTGTPLYMAPEQVRGQAVDARADIWAWGAVTYQLLSGRTPFLGDSIVALMMNIVQGDPEPLQTWRPDLPQPWSETVMRALQKPLEARWQSMSEALARLEGRALFEGQSAAEPAVSAPPVTLPRPNPPVSMEKPLEWRQPPGVPNPLEAMTESDWPVGDHPIDATVPPRARPKWYLPALGAVGLLLVGGAALTLLNRPPAAPNCQPWARSSERVALASSGALEWQRGAKTIFGTAASGAALTDCGTFAYGAVNDVKALYPGATRASRQVIALPHMVLTVDRTVGVKRASLEFPEALTPVDNANTDGQEFYSTDKRFVFAALEPSVPGVEYTWQGKRLNWSFYDYKLQPTQNFFNVLQTLDVDEGAELTYPTGLPDDGSVTGIVVTRGNQRTAVFFNFVGPTLPFDGVNVPPGIGQYLITNLRPGARYDLKFEPDRNWWSLNLVPGGRYTVSSSGVLLLESQPPR